MKKNEWKKRDGVVYSTNTDFAYQHVGKQEDETPPASKQQLRVTIDRRDRAGKQVTVVSGFVGKTSDLEELTKKLKSKCGVGGSAKEGEIILQGDVREKVSALLSKDGFKVR